MHITFGNETHKCIGCIDIRVVPQHQKARFGFILNRHYWNKGYMTEALSAVISFCFNVLELNRVASVKRASKYSDKLRPLGIPAYKDKLVQGVMADILTEIYEPNFLDLSYGFRPKRSCHQAVLDLDNKIIREPVNFIVEVDIKGFFDNINHDWLIKFLEHDIEDKNFIRYIIYVSTACLR